MVESIGEEGLADPVPAIKFALLLLLFNCTAAWPLSMVDLGMYNVYIDRSMQ